MTDVRCSICQSAVDPASPASAKCAKCGAPYHYVCWVYNDRLCAVYGCEKTSVQEEERDVLAESGGQWGARPMRWVVFALAGGLSFLFLLLAMDTCRRG